MRPQRAGPSPVHGEILFAKRKKKSICYKRKHQGLRLKTPLPGDTGYQHHTGAHKNNKAPSRTTALSSSKKVAATSYCARTPREAGGVGALRTLAALRTCDAPRRPGAGEADDAEPPGCACTTARALRPLPPPLLLYSYSCAASLPPLPLLLVFDGEEMLLVLA